MQRDERLAPFSREHHQTLRFARELSRCASHAADSLQSHWKEIRTIIWEYWRESMAAHFAAEETRLPLEGLEPDWASRLTRDHRDIEAMIEDVLNSARADADLLLSLGTRLQAHVRWEEQALFPALERSGSELPHWEPDAAPFQRRLPCLATNASHSHTGRRNRPVRKSIDTANKGDTA